MNLFKKIWSKNFLKAKEPLDKFSEDIGGLKGEFSWIKYRNGQKVDTFTHHNEITSISKSTVIRLLAQGSSSWRGTIDPTQYKISRMRFGNAPYTHNSFSYNTDLNLYYYDLNESVNRPNLTNPVSGYSPAGGRFFIGNPTAPAGSTGPILSNSLSNVVKTINRTTEYTSWTNDKIVPISIIDDNFNSGVVFDQESPPSHRTLLVEFLNSGGTVIASLNFNTVYSRDTDGNNPVIVTGNNYLNNTPANHKLYYSYPTGTETKGSWILQFMLGSGVVNDIINIRGS